MRDKIFTNKTKYLSLIVVAIILIAATVVAIFLSREKFYDLNAKDGVLIERTQEEIDYLIATPVEEGNLQVSINSNPVFLDGTSNGNLRIENAPNNIYDMRVVITIDETKEVIYKSGAIKPYQYIENAQLDVDLDKGIYNVIVDFYAIDNKNNDIGIVTRNIVLEILE